MNVTAQHEDALRELINIGYGRAAAALSELTQARVLLDAPKVSLIPIEDVQAALDRIFSTGVACVNQAFNGPITGNAVLLLDERSAHVLANLIARSDDAADAESVQDVVREVGNIVLNACLGVFGNLLHVQVSFTVPQLSVGSVGALLRTLTINAEPLSHALLVHTRFTIRQSNVRGYLSIVLGLPSTRRLLGAVDEWIEDL